MEKSDRYIDLLDRFMSGSTSPEEERELLGWFRNDCSKEEIFSFYKRKWEEEKGRELSAEIQGRMFHQIKCRMETSKRRSFKSWWSYAAVALICLGLGIGSHWYYQGQTPLSEPLDYVVSADNGQRASVVLPDGTKVWLNSHTKLTYKSDYGIKDRSVSLAGEAYFEVAKDTIRRFLVNAGGMEIEALGTTFNVKAYEDDDESTVTLFEGSVRAVAGNEMAVLSPDQYVSFNKANKRLYLEKCVNTSYACMWRNNELAFESETLEDIAVLLNRMYNVQVKFESERIKRYRFSGVIKNNSLDNIFEIISLTAPILYESVGDTITLSEK